MKFWVDWQEGLEVFYVSEFFVIIKERLTFHLDLMTNLVRSKVDRNKYNKNNNNVDFERIDINDNETDLWP